MSKHSHAEKKKHFPLLKLALGAALAAGAGYYYTHKEEVDKEAKKRIDLLAKLFKEKRAEVERRVNKVWGNAGKDAIATYMDLRGQVLHALEKENLKKQGKMLKENYDRIVVDIVKSARQSGVLTPDVEKKLAELFKMDWNQVKNVLKDLLTAGAQKTAQFVRKAKVANKVRKVKKVVKAAAKVKVKAKVKAVVKAKKAVPRKAARRKITRPSKKRGKK
jgi:hypothetical protein